MPVNYVALGIAGFLVIVLLYLGLRTGKNRRYKVTLGNNEIRHVTRDWRVSLNDRKDSTCFRNEKGKLVWFSNHFTITREEE